MAIWDFKDFMGRRWRRSQCEGGIFEGGRDWQMWMCALRGGSDAVRGHREMLPWTAPTGILRRNG
ncbi:MAG: hypothetical protein ACLVAW_29520 [Eisenbergiella massiliensis]